MLRRSPARFNLLKPNRPGSLRRRTIVVVITAATITAATIIAVIIVVVTAIIVAMAAIIIAVAGGIMAIATAVAGTRTSAIDHHSEASGSGPGAFNILGVCSMKFQITGLAASRLSMTGVAYAEPPPVLPDVFQPPKAARLQSPNVQFQDPDGKDVALADWRGKVIILNVWATWCGPCVEEIPSLDRLADRIGSERLEVLAVSQDKGGASAAKAYFEKLGVKHLRAFADPEMNLTRGLGVRALPTTFVLDADGTFLGRLRGFSCLGHRRFCRRFCNLSTKTCPLAGITTNERSTTRF